MTPKSASFPTFFESLWGRPPFPWQTRLLEQVVSHGWPATLDLPTGAGKTATLEIALFALALDAAKPASERKQSRRIVLVVDRRVVVDQAFERAVAIAKKLDEAKTGVLADVANALRELSGNSEGLPVLPAILRGGMPRESEWAKSPSQPVILTSTVDQVGSRLLFRGYGVSDGMRPIHAGLLGSDTLVLLDEVHLARPFEETLSALTHFYDSRPSESLARPLRFVRMSATVADPSQDRFQLEEEDRANPALVARLSGKKPASLRQVNTPKDPVKASDALAKATYTEAKKLTQSSARAVAVIVNRVETARKIAVLCRNELAGEWAVSLLTGRMRPLDRLEKQSAVLEHVLAGRKRNDASPRHLVVSTQAIEAGADFDFDALITECASLDALRQRFGRLDRLGDLGSSEAVILAGSSSVDEKSDADPIYGTALRETWHFLNEIAARSDERDASVVDFGIDTMNGRLESIEPSRRLALVAPRAVAPILTSSHATRWVQTSPAPHADPEVGPFLHGMQRGTAEVQLVWRADLTPEHLTPSRRTALQGVLEAVRPSSLEALSVPLWAAKRWLSSVRARSAEATEEPAPPDVTDVEGAKSDEVETPSGIAPVLEWRGGEVLLVSSVDELRPGATLVVPSSYGGLDADFACWDPASTTAVRDRGDEAQLLQKGRAVLRWAPAVIGGWLPPSSERLALEVAKGALEERGTFAEREVFDAWRKTVESDPRLPAWAKLALEHLGRRSSTQRIDLSDPDERLWRVQTTDRPVPRSRLRELLGLPELRHAPFFDQTGEGATEGDEGSFLGSAVSLTRHLNGVRDFATRFASALGLPKELTNDLALAGWIHDVGKADRRFQLLLHGGDAVREASSDELLAKSSVPANDRDARERARELSGYPKGMRHELLSVELARNEPALRARAHDWDLVLHLVASHHGWCRPFAPPVLDPEPIPVSFLLEDMTLTASSDHELSRFDSEVPERFWTLVNRYGPWGLAWLEAILRLADHRESEAEERKNSDVA